MKTGLTKKQKTTAIYFDEDSPMIEVITYNTDLKNRLLYRKFSFYTIRFSDFHNCISANRRIQTPTIVGNFFRQSSEKHCKIHSQGV